MGLFSLLLGRLLIGLALVSALTGNWAVVGGVIAIYAFLYFVGERKQARN